MLNDRIPPETAIESRAISSNCETYRYFLSRTWDETLPVLMFVMLNPSKATVAEPDDTVKLCTNRAAINNEFGSLWVLNLFAHYATNPRDLDPVAPDDLVVPYNDEIIRQKVGLVTERDTIVCGWGNDKIIRRQDIVRQDIVVKGILRERNLPLYRLAMCGQGNYPVHPLPPLNGFPDKAFVEWND